MCIFSLTQTCRVSKKENIVWTQSMEERIWTLHLWWKLSYSRALWSHSFTLFETYICLWVPCAMRGGSHGAAPWDTIQHTSFTYEILGHLLILWFSNSNYCNYLTLSNSMSNENIQIFCGILYISDVDISFYCLAV